MLRDPARRNVLILALAQGLMMAGTSTLIAEAALVGHMLADNKALATLPLALQQLTVMATTIPASPVAAEGVDAGRPLAVIARQPAFVVAVLGGMISYGGMSFVMNATPLAMIACGHQFEDSALVIQLHVLAMFLPAFWTGRIIER